MGKWAKMTKIARLLTISVFPTKLDQDCKIAKSPRFTLQVTVLDSRHNVSLSVLLQLLLQKATNFYTNNNNNYYYYYDDDDDGSYY